MVDPRRRRAPRRTAGAATLLAIVAGALVASGCGARQRSASAVIQEPPASSAAPNVATRSPSAPTGVPSVAITSPPPGPSPAPRPAHAPGTPFDLDEAIDLALRQNPDVEAAAARIEEARARVGEATSAFFPQVMGRLGYVRTDSPAQAFGMILNQRRFSFDLNFNDPGATQNVRPEIVGALPLFRGGQDWQRRKAAELGVDAARLEREALRNAIAEAVVAAYAAMLAAPEQVAASRSSEQAVRRAIEQARAQVDAGTALPSDVLSLEARLAEASENRLRAENAVDLSREALRVLLGMSAEEPLEVRVSSRGDAIGRLPLTLDDALETAADQRPEIAAASRSVAIREAELAAERAAWLPRVDAFGNYGNDSSDLQLAHRADNWTFGVAAEIDVFNGFRTRERVRAAQSRLEAARQAERKAKLDATRDVRTAWLTLHEVREREEVSRRALAAAEEALRLVQVQYEAGAATLTRYLEAEAAAAAARSRAIAARYEVRRSEAGLAKAIGALGRRDTGDS